MGQMLIPIGLREEIGLAVGDNLEVWVDDQAIILRKFEPKCVFCEAHSTEMIPFKQSCNEAI